VTALAQKQPGAPLPTVLIVDDNFDDRRILTSILEFYGYRVETAVTGSAGIDAAQRLRPDLILMNLELPDTDGITATQTIRADAAIGMTPVLCLSNFEIAPDKADPRDYGCNEILVAPFSPPDLIAAVRRNIAMPSAR
jgi:two-component system, cell cycle response regulator DivK